MSYLISVCGIVICGLTPKYTRDFFNYHTQQRKSSTKKIVATCDFRFIDSGTLKLDPSKCTQLYSGPEQTRESQFHRRLYKR